MVRLTPKKSATKPTLWRLRRMSREAKVHPAAKMTSTLYEVTMDSIRKRHPGISREKLFQLTRRRLQRRPPIRMDEAVPFFAETGRPKLSDLAGRWKMTSKDTEEILKGLKRFWSRCTP